MRVWEWREKELQNVSGNEGGSESVRESEDE